MVEALAELQRPALGRDGGDDVVRERCGLEMVDVKTDRRATFYVQQVLRRYVEDQRVVVVWHAYFEPSRSTRSWFEACTSCSRATC